MVDVFSAHAEVYDRSRAKLIPCFDKFYGSPVQILEAHEVMPSRALDLGAGTGLLSAIISQSILIEELVLVDQSKSMLNLAKGVFENIPSAISITCKLQDLNSGKISGHFDAIWSSLAIHHLTDIEKKDLFEQIYDLLRPGGIFINADQSLGVTEEVEKLYRWQWLKDVRAAGVKEDDLLMALERMKEDRMDTLENQLNWMSETGFTHVNTWFQDFSFNVYSGIREI